MRLLEQRHQLAFRIGVFLSLGPGLSGAFGGLLAAGFLNGTLTFILLFLPFSARSRT
jgi:hypothetical protein